MTTRQSGIHDRQALAPGALVLAWIGETVTRLRRFVRQHTVAAAAAVVLGLVVFMAVAAPLLAPEDPLFADFSKIATPPDSESMLGTDQIGRDLLSRNIYGSRISLFVALVSVSLGTGVGFTWGISSGFVGGKFDLVSQRLVEIILSLPGLILAMALAIALGASVWTVIFAIAVTITAPSARVIRSVVLSVREMPYVEAARAIGARHARIMLLHIAPQAMAVYLVMFTASLGGAILTEAALSFIGVGIPPPTASWGNMLGEASNRYPPHWWYVIFPGILITITVLAFNLFGDGLRDILDPRLRGTRGES